MAYDLGDVATLAIQIKDNTGTLANATSVVATVTAPDGTTSTPSVTNGSTGNYSVAFTATQVGRHSIRWVATGTNAGAYTDVFEIGDPALLPVVSLSDLKDWLGKSQTSTTDDEKLRSILNVATDMCERYTNRALRRRTFVESHNAGTVGYWGQLGAASGSPSIILWQRPVIAVTTVVENGVTLTASDYTLDANAGILYRGSSIAAGSYSWYGGEQGVTITYTAGYTNPPDVAQHTVKEVCRWLFAPQRGSVALPSLGGGDDFASTYSNDAVPMWLFRPLDSLRMDGFA